MERERGGGLVGSLGAEEQHACVISSREKWWGEYCRNRKLTSQEISVNDHEHTHIKKHTHTGVEGECGRERRDPHKTHTHCAHTQTHTATHKKHERSHRDTDAIHIVSAPKYHDNIVS